MAMRSVPPAKADAAVSPSRKSAATAVPPRTSLIEIIRNLQHPPPAPRRPATSKRLAPKQELGHPRASLSSHRPAALEPCASPKFRHHALALGKAHIEIGGRSSDFACLPCPPSQPSRRCAQDPPRQLGCRRAQTPGGRPRALARERARPGASAAPCCAPRGELRGRQNARAA